jgi:hypothetical protein
MATAKIEEFEGKLKKVLRQRKENVLITQNGENQLRIYPVDRDYVYVTEWYDSFSSILLTIEQVERQNKATEPDTLYAELRKLAESYSPAFFCVYFPCFITVA